MHRTRTLPVLLFAPVILLIGCGDGPAALDEPEPAEPETWTLESVAGSVLPVALVRGSDEFTWDSGQLVLNGDGTCRHTLTSTPAGGTQETVTQDCVYTRGGGDFRYTAAGVTYQGAVHGSFTIAITETGLTFASTGGVAGWRTYTRPGR